MHLAEAFVASEGEYDRERNYKGTGANGHSDEERQKEISKSGVRGAVCYGCNQLGLIAWECPQNVNEHWKHDVITHVPWERPAESEMVNAMDCSFHCGGEVPVWDHPVVMAWIVGKPVQAMLDMGCSQTLSGLIWYLDKMSKEANQFVEIYSWRV